MSRLTNADNLLKKLGNKMTPKEAIEYAKKVNFCVGCNKPQFAENPAEICSCCEHRQFYEIVTVALELLIPRKPLRSWHNSLVCACCGKLLTQDPSKLDELEFCPHCSQAIDREDNK